MGGIRPRLIFFPVFPCLMLPALSFMKSFMKLDCGLYLNRDCTHQVVAFKAEHAHCYSRHFCAPATLKQPISHKMVCQVPEKFKWNQIWCQQLQQSLQGGTLHSQWVVSLKIRALSQRPSAFSLGPVRFGKAGVTKRPSTIEWPS